MKARSTLLLTASALVMGLCAPAQATQFYVGAGLEVGSSKMSDEFGNHADADLVTGSVIVGAVMPLGTNWFVSAEGETTLFTSYDSDVYTGNEDVDRIWRLRARGGYDFGQWAIYGALGGVWVDGDVAGEFEPGSPDGVTYGGGVEYAFDDRIDLRLEVIRDETDYNNADGTYEWDNTSLRAGAVIKF